VSGANTHDVKLLEETLDSIVICRPKPTLEKPQHLCLDAGYTGHDDEVITRMYIPHIRPRGEEKQLIEKDSNFKPRRWVVEVAHSWIHRFRKLLIRYEKKDSSYIALRECCINNDYPNICTISSKIPLTWKRAKSPTVKSTILNDLDTIQVFRRNLPNQ
jgi:hypothetical protein